MININNDVLKYALDHDIIDIDYIQAQVDMDKRKELLKKHPYKIWQGKDGKWYTYIFDRVSERRLLKKRTNKKAIEDVAVQWMTSEIENPTLKEVFTEWNDRRLELGKIVRSSHLRYKKMFEKHFETFGKRRIKDIIPEEVLDFLEEQIPTWDMSAKAFGNLKTITRGMLKRAKRRRLIQWNADEVFFNLDVSDRDFKKTIKEDYQEVFDDEERRKMIGYLTENVDQTNLGILLMFATGMRVGEMVALKPQDIIDDHAIQIRRTETCYVDEREKYHYDVKDFPKTSAGVRTVVVPDEFAWVVRCIKRNNPFGEFCFENNGKRMTVRATASRLRRICDWLDIYPKSPHKIRKTYGSILLDNNVDSRMILDQMGHTNILTTENFYHRNRKHIDKKRKILNDLPEFNERGRVKMGWM